MLTIRITPEKKKALAELAKKQGKDNTKLVMPLIDRLLLDWSNAPLDKGDHGREQILVASPSSQTTSLIDVQAGESKDDESLGDDENRINFRALPGDAKIMKATAARRGMKPSEFMKLLLRSWVSSNPVMPDKELNTLSNTLNELGAVGRNLNQITRRIHSGDYSANESLVATLNDTRELVLRLKDEIRAVIKANIESWERDYAE